MPRAPGTPVPSCPAWKSKALSKKIIKKYWLGDDLRPSKDASLEIFWDRKFSKFFDLKIFHFHSIFNENFSMKISKFFDLKIFRLVDFFVVTFVPVKLFGRFFFNRCRFSWRTRWDRNPVDLERLGGRKLVLSPETGGGQKWYRSEAHYKKTKLYASQKEYRFWIFIP